MRKHPIGVNEGENPLYRPSPKKTHFLNADVSSMNSHAFPWLRRAFFEGITERWFCDGMRDFFLHWLLWGVSSSFSSHISKTTDFRSMDTKTFSTWNSVIFRLVRFFLGVPIRDKEVEWQNPLKMTFKMIKHMCIGCKIKMHAGLLMTLFSLRRFVFEKNAKNWVSYHPV